ncbi:TetR/AcrR family transcriptional regulator [Chordicoccus furentiruminis]|uniref:TetR/AcrR family transcriptional regulator n=1 Tax=Chordicoccus furentiruminis TaxID=2709410 RepID=UPI0023A907F0|nr:TetR/AcrR family transcriptional regulator [Chordicoccus furentiruminis]
MRRQTTKELLAASFLELAQKKPIDKITITQITDNCGMSQPTFYHHFRDKYDLISFIHSENLSRIIAEAAEDRGGWKKASADCARYYKANRVYILNACNAPGIRETYIMNIERINEKFIGDAVRKKTEGGEISKVLDNCIKVYCYGNLLFLFDWLSGKTDLSEDEIAEIWDKSLPDPLRPYMAD